MTDRPHRRNVLFVCARNQWRSPTAEALYRDDERFNVRSRGVSPAAKRVLCEADLAWADIIFVMESNHRKRILGNRSTHELPEIIVLHIPDEFAFMDPELVVLITEGVEDWWNSQDQ